jgi:hypothetical protein
MKRLILTGLFAGEHAVMDESDDIQHARHDGHLQ